MKKKLVTFLMSALVLAFLPGCKKVLDYIHDNPSADFTECQIQEIILPGGVKGTFTYNKHGDPVSVIYTSNTSERPNFSFKYDNKRRLIESLEYYDNGVYKYWSRYKYNKDGLIISDSTYEAGLIVNGAPIPGDAERLVRNYTYDAQNRITKIVQHWPDSPESGEGEIEWQYDANGNRQSEGPALTYDNKMNIHRTHKVFMFIDREYSRNNHIGATSYNAKYLPTQFGSTVQRFLIVGLANSQITYKCK
ncbi:MAG TPA: hypothetical protein VHN59_06330 [Chitinophagaceae bacterium]|nr:hypothetical protein [Chitinophagaceae bacterium]